MRRPASPTPLQLGLVCALIVLPATLVAQQDQPGVVLPPPSLYDSPPPPGEAGAVTVPPVTAPVVPVAPVPPRTAQPVGVEPPRATPAPVPSAAVPVTPAPSSAPVATPAASTAPMATPAPRTAQPVAPAPVSPQPAARAPAPATGASDPWYRRWWDSMTGRAGGGNGQQKAPAAPVVQPKAAAAAAAPVALDEGYVSNTPGQVVRSAASGQCVKTGQWTEADERACNAARAVAKVEPAPQPAPAAPAPQPAPRAPVAQPTPEPVEVRPLAAPQLKQDLVLESETVAVMQRPAPVPAPPRTPEPPGDKMTLSADTLFALDSYTLRPNARETLDELVARLRKVDFELIKITGHTDPTGTAALNHRLSRQRAEEVKRYLVAHGVSGDKIRAEGVGSNLPMVIERDCATLPRPKKIACYQPDRRVDIEVMGATEKLAKQ